MQGFPAWQVLLVDIRCHGESANLPPPPGPHGVESSAQDILKLLSQLKLFPEVLIGHSFGGKVVMSMGEQFGASGKRLPRPVQVKYHAFNLPPSWPRQCTSWRQAFVWSNRLRRQPSVLCDCTFIFRNGTGQQHCVLPCFAGAVTITNIDIVALEVSMGTHKRPPSKSIPCHLRNHPK